MKYESVLRICMGLLVRAAPLATAACGVAGAEPSSGQSLEDDSNAEPVTLEGDRPGVKDVLLVHGSWADGSSWSAVIEALQRRGFVTFAVQLSERSLSDDAALVRNTLTQIPNPVVVVGHSYGGAVISAATTGVPNVHALVYAAAFAPDAGESLGELTASYPTAGLQELTFDNQGFATLDTQRFLKYFAPDIPVEQARVLAAVQHPISGTILGEAARDPGWKTIPTYYQVSTHDQIIHPDLERFFARRMNAKTIELESSHASPVAHPRDIARFIERAARAK
jgi:pimeloyl-ACP methyl ester carboxylesterase